MKCKCGNESFITEQKGTQTGLYCSKCGKWIKWINKKELCELERVRIIKVKELTISNNKEIRWRNKTNFQDLQTIEDEYKMTDRLIYFISHHKREIFRSDGTVNSLPLLYWLQAIKEEQQ